MSARAYDVIITVGDASAYRNQNSVIGHLTETRGLIANVNATTNELKVKLGNTQQEFSSSEAIISNSTVSSVSAGGDGLLTTTPFKSNVVVQEVTTANSNATAIAPSPFIAEKNAFSQNPIVRLYKIYYPGEWYPTNKAGNPTGEGEGRAWPNDFPIKFAEIVGDLTSDISYNVLHGGDSYIPFPVNVDTITQGSEGTIEDINVTIFNVDNIISRLVEDPFIVGYNSSNSTTGTVNGETVEFLDPRTVPSNVHFNQTVVDSVYGSNNSSWSFQETINAGDTWVEQKLDSRDLLGGVVSIKTTFANFLDFWPEYSTVKSVSANVIQVLNSLPYRVGDNVRSTAGTTEATIQKIVNPDHLFLSNSLDPATAIGNPIYIINEDADESSYIEYNFKIDQLESLNEHVATFSLISFLQYFKLVAPKRKFYKNTCQWVYKGPECQYPGPAGGTIPGTSLSANTNPIAANNQTASSAAGDVCGKSIISCTIRNNQIHFGGFPSTGRTIPRQ